MKYLSQLCTLLGFTFLGDALHRILPLPIPGAVYGLILLFLALCCGVVKLEQVKEIAEQGELESFISPVDIPFLEYPKVVIEEKYDKWLLNGNKLKGSWFVLQKTDSLVRVYDARNEFIGLYEWEGSDLKPHKLFLG